MFKSRSKALLLTTVLFYVYCTQNNQPWRSDVIWPRMHSQEVERLELRLLELCSWDYLSSQLSTESFREMLK